MLSIEFLKKFSEPVNVFCPFCLLDDKKVKLHIVNYNNLQCTEKQEHFFDLGDIIELGLFVENN